MKVKCIDAGDYSGLTTDKVYLMLDDVEELYNIINNHNDYCWYPKSNFEIIEDSVQIENSEMSNLDSKIKELKEQLEVLIKAKEILEK